MALLVKDADKLIWGQYLVVTTPHAIEGVLKQPPYLWPSNAYMTYLQILLISLGWLSRIGRILRIYCQPEELAS